MLEPVQGVAKTFLDLGWGGGGDFLPAPLHSSSCWQRSQDVQEQSMWLVWHDALLLIAMTCLALPNGNGARVVCQNSAQLYL